MSMTSTDPIADMLSRIRNAIAVRKSEISLPHSNVKESVARLLKESNFINDIRIIDATVGKTLVLVLNDEDSNARITEIERLSKPGRRYYVSAQEIPVIKRGRGVVIVSTSKGMMTGSQAKAEHVGGELICKVY
ncbi:MAG TPA: 30S ribosomal protein S8 [Candidatus Saccharimonadales bacterium]|nr:30S ribosomal protein S8 [Candidatus Saccharimonadales bacterium]